MIEVQLTGGMETEYTTHPVSVGGRFTSKPDPATRQFLNVPYQIQADLLR